MGGVLDLCHALRPRSVQPFFCTLANKLPFYLCRQAERKGQYLAAYILSQFKALFDAHYLYVLFHQAAK